MTFCTQQRMSWLFNVFKAQTPHTTLRNSRQNSNQIRENKLDVIKRLVFFEEGKGIQILQLYETLKKQLFEFFTLKSNINKKNKVKK